MVVLSDLLQTADLFEPRQMIDKVELRFNRNTARAKSHPSSIQKPYEVTFITDRVFDVQVILSSGVNATCRHPR